MTANMTDKRRSVHRVDVVERWFPFDQANAEPVDVFLNVMDLDSLLPDTF